MSAASVDTLRYRSHYAGDPAARAALADLLHDVFGLDLGPLETIGWDPSCRPFSYFDEIHRCVANVSVFAMPMIVHGIRVDALGVQSVAVRPEWRGRGLFRDLMERALAWCDGHAPLVLLQTNIPTLYIPFGFREVPEHRFVGPAPAPRRTGSARPLSLEAQEDVRLLRRLLAGRTPVSHRVGLLDQATMFLLNAVWKRPRLRHLPEHDAVVAAETDESGMFRLLDIVGTTIPPLAEILGALGAHPARIEVCFPPDRLAWNGAPRPLANSSGLMARGAFVDSEERFMLPPTAAF